MTWVKISDTALDEPFLLDVPRGAVLLHIEALAYSNRHATDGVIHRAALRKLTTEPDPEAAAAILVAAKLWTVTDDGWKAEWLLKDQPGSGEIHASREAARIRQDRRRRHNNGDHTICDPERCKVLIAGARDGKRDGARDGKAPPSRPSPSRPDPTPPDRKGGGEEKGDDDGPRPIAALVSRECVMCEREFLGAGYDLQDTNDSGEPMRVVLCSLRCQEKWKAA